MTFHTNPHYSTLFHTNPHSPFPPLHTPPPHSPYGVWGVVVVELSEGEQGDLAPQQSTVAEARL